MNKIRTEFGINAILSVLAAVIGLGEELFSLCIFSFFSRSKPNTKDIFGFFGRILCDMGLDIMGGLAAISLIPLIGGISAFILAYVAAYKLTDIYGNKLTGHNLCMKMAELINAAIYIPALFALSYFLINKLTSL